MRDRPLSSCFTTGITSVGLCARPSDRAPPIRVRTRTPASPRFAPAPSAVAAATVLPPPAAAHPARRLRAIAARASPPSRSASDLDDGSPLRAIASPALRGDAPSHRAASSPQPSSSPRAACAGDERRPEIPYLKHGHHRAPHKCEHECGHPCPVLVPVPSTEPSSVPTTGASHSRLSMPQFRHRYPLSRRSRPLPSSVPAATAHTKRCPACHPEPPRRARRLRAIAHRSLWFKCDPARHLARSKCADAVALRALYWRSLLALPVEPVRASRLTSASSPRSARRSAASSPPRALPSGWALTVSHHVICHALRRSRFYPHTPRT